MGKTSSTVHNRYRDKTYERVEIFVPMGNKIFLKAEAAKSGESVNAFITRAVLAQIGISEWPERQEEDETQST